MKKILLLLLGFVVIFLPLAYLSALSEDIARKTNEIEMGFLRKELTIATRKLHDDLKVENYLKSLFTSLEDQFLPGFSKKLEFMIPDLDYGRENFNQHLPVKIRQHLAAEGVEPLMILVAANSVDDRFFWVADEIFMFCGRDIDQMMVRMLYEMLKAVNSFYSRAYQRDWARPSSMPESNLLTKIEAGLHSDDDLVRTLSRYNRFDLEQDSVTKVYSDYYGKQILYAYMKGFCSSVTIHGAYLVLVKQKSVAPDKLIELAIAKADERFRVRLADLAAIDDKNHGSKNSAKSLVRLPTAFFQHLEFYNREHKTALLAGYEEPVLVIEAIVPAAVLRTGFLASFVNFSVKFSVFLYYMAAVRLYLFGISFSFSIKRKLSLILGGIILIPLSGTVLLAWSMAGSEELLLEMQTRVATENIVGRFRQKIHEINQQPQIGATIIKKAAQDSPGINSNLFDFLLQLPDAKSLLWFFSYFYTVDSRASFVQERIFDLQRIPGSRNRLLTALLTKFVNNLGLLQTSDRDVANALEQQTRALGIMNNLVPVEQEKQFAVNEGTVRRDLVTARDTVKAVPLILDHGGDSMGLLLLSDVRSVDDNFSELVSDFGSMRQHFSSQGRHAEVDLALRIRTLSSYRPYTWPADLAQDQRFKDAFDLAMKGRDSGTRVIRHHEGIQVLSWFYQPEEETVMAAVGASRPGFFAHMLLSMFVPSLLVYSLIVFIFVTALAGEFMVKPINILQNGIDAINKQEYGTLIDEFAQDEFNDITQAFNEMSTALRQREIIRRHVSERLYEQVEAGVRADEQVRVSVLTSDIRRFTTISEKYSPVEIVEMLNSYFTLMESVIKAQGGIIDKFVGDAIQAVFYQNDSASRACRAALSMRSALKEFNVERLNSGFFTIENGVGIATGEVISGSIGGREGRKDFAITGAATEIAAQLEALTVNTASRILICSSTNSLLNSILKTSKFSEEAWEVIG